MFLAMLAFSGLALGGVVEFYPWRVGHRAESVSVASLSISAEDFELLAKGENKVADLSRLYPGCFLAKWNQTEDVSIEASAGERKPSSASDPEVMGPEIAIRLCLRESEI